VLGVLIFNSTFMVTKKYILSFLAGMFFLGLGGVFNTVKAATPLTGGSSIYNAVELTPGSYQGGALEEDSYEYFYISGIKAGQEVNIKGTFSPDDTRYGAEAVFILYDEDEITVIDKSEISYDVVFNSTISWLVNNEQSSYKYYLEVGCGTWGLSSYSLEVSVNDYYDAGTGQDAGDDFSSAMSIGSGTFTGYLAGEAGTDVDDYYKVNIKSGETLSVEVTPSSYASADLYINNSDREEIAVDGYGDPGMILKASVTAEKDDYFYVNVVCNGYWCSEEIMDYSLKISGAEVTDAGVEQFGSEEEGIGIEVGFLKSTTTIFVALCVVSVLGIVAFGIVIYVIMKMRKDKQKRGAKKPEGGNVGAGPGQPSSPPV
jgi:hypothetical protein